MMVGFSFVMNCSVNSGHFVALKLFVFANVSRVFCLLWSFKIPVCVQFQSVWMELHPSLGSSRVLVFAHLAEITMLARLVILASYLISFVLV